jgi:hypothetical protein
MGRRIRRPSAAMVVACVALFVATAGSAAAAFVISSNSQIAPNTIYGANKPASANDNIVNGSIANADIKANGIAGNRITDGSLTGADLANNTLTGTQINEDTLGTVPNASALGGNAPGAFFHIQRTAHAVTSNCGTAAQTWMECAPVTLTVPSGHAWYVTVISTVTANPGNAYVEPLFCPSTDGPQCITGTPERTSYQPNLYSNWSSTATGLYGGGTYRFNTGMKWPFALPSISDAYTSTTVIAYDSRQENVTG